MRDKRGRFEEIIGGNRCKMHKRRERASVNSPNVQGKLLYCSHNRHTAWGGRGRGRGGRERGREKVAKQEQSARVMMPYMARHVQTCVCTNKQGIASSPLLRILKLHVFMPRNTQLDKHYSYYLSMQKKQTQSEVKRLKIYHYKVTDIIQQLQPHMPTSLEPYPQYITGRMDECRRLTSDFGMNDDGPENAGSGTRHP